jgi:hypothetical protein
MLGIYCVSMTTMWRFVVWFFRSEVLNSYLCLFNNGNSALPRKYTKRRKSSFIKMEKFKYCCVKTLLPRPELNCDHIGSATGPIVSGSSLPERLVKIKPSSLNERGQPTRSGGTKKNFLKWPAHHKQAVINKAYLTQEVLKYYLFGYSSL